VQEKSIDDRRADPKLTCVSLVHQDPIDLEVIEAILDATASLFLQYCEEESAKTALERSRSQTSLELDI
jgi:hypothetical protein